MPIYEYECCKCGKTTEAMQRFSDPPLTECANCHGPMRKLISMSTFHLKGSGWYVTDYAGKNPGAAKPAENKAETVMKKIESASSTSSPSAKDS